jgi:hypothetical protein
MSDFLEIGLKFFVSGRQAKIKTPELKTPSKILSL